MNTLDARTDLNAQPWTHLPVGPIPLGVIESVAIVPNGGGEEKAMVAVLVRMADGNPIVAEVSLTLALKAAELLARSRAVRAEMK